MVGNLPDDPLTINTPPCKELARFVKTETVATSELQIGDIVVDDFGCWHVAILKLEGDCTDVSDADNNGGATLPDHTWTIIDRSCLR